MKKLSTLFLVFISYSTLVCGQSIFELKPDQDHQLAQASKTSKEKLRGNQSVAKQITTEFLALSGYGSGGTTVEIPFRIILDNLDFEYGDSISMTFPEGFTILAVSNDDVFGPSYDNPDGTDGDPEPFNGIDGQTVSWGDNDNVYGGISTRATYEALDRPSGPYYHFTVTVNIDESVSGAQTIDFHISGDEFGDNPGDLDGTITLDEGLSVAGIICSSEDHNTLQDVVYEVGVMYGLGPISPDIVVFAPTDEAFDALPDGLLDELLADPDGALRNVLLYHGSAPSYFTEDMSDGQEIITGLLETVTISFEGDDIYVNDALIVVEDVEATNGVVQVIDAVLLPPPLVSPIGLPLEFEFPVLSYNFLGFEGAASEIWFNPDPSGINTSERVMRSIKTEGAAFFAGTVVFMDEAIDFSTSSMISVDTWSPKMDIPVKLRIENFDNSEGVEVDVNTTVTNEWETLTYDFEDLLNPDVDYVRVVVFFEFIDDLPGDGSTYYYDNVRVGDPLGLGEISSITDFNLYPNPANLEFAIELDLMENSKLTIDVVNILGQNVKSFDLGERSAGFNRELLDVNDLQEGMYILNITIGNDQATTKLQITR